MVSFRHINHEACKLVIFQLTTSNEMFIRPLATGFMHENDKLRNQVIVYFVKKFQRYQNIIK